MLAEADPLGIWLLLNPKRLHLILRSEDNKDETKRTLLEREEATNEKNDSTQNEELPDSYQTRYRRERRAWEEHEVAAIQEGGQRDRRTIIKTRTDDQLAAITTMALDNNLDISESRFDPSSEANIELI